MDSTIIGLAGLVIVGVGYLLRNEQRLSRLETKVDLVLKTVNSEDP